MCYFFDPRDLWNSKNFSLHGVRCCVMNSPVCSHCLCFQCEDFVSNTGRRDSRVFLCSKGRLGKTKYQILKITLPHFNSATIQTPYPKLMDMVSFCWKMNVLLNKIKNSVSSTMFMKLTIKVVAFFSGPPCIYSGLSVVPILSTASVVYFHENRFFVCEIIHRQMKINSQYNTDSGSQ